MEFNTKQYKCKYCDKEFLTKGSLTVHERVHTGEKPYMCTRCGKSFKQASALTVHQRVHTGEKPFYCQHCGKAFSYKCNMTVHIATHVSEQPFHCYLCGKAFAARCALIVHNKTAIHHYKCDYCDKAFQKEQDLEVHEKLHNVDEEIEKEIFLHYFKLRRASRIRPLPVNFNNTFSDIVPVSTISTCGSEYRSLHIDSQNVRYENRRQQCYSAANFQGDLEDITVVSDTYKKQIENHTFFNKAISCREVRSCDGTNSSLSPQNGENSNSMRSEETLKCSLAIHEEKTRFDNSRINQKSVSRSKYIFKRKRFSDEVSFKSIRTYNEVSSISKTQNRRFTLNNKVNFSNSVFYQQSFYKNRFTSSTNSSTNSRRCGHYRGFLRQKIIKTKLYGNPVNSTNAIRPILSESDSDIKEVSDDESILFPCLSCDKKFHNFLSLITHRKEHFGRSNTDQIRSYSHKSCQTVPVTKNTSEESTTPHTSDKMVVRIPFPFLNKALNADNRSRNCQYCKKSFTDLNVLSAHENSHTRDKPFPCEYCGKCFALKAAVKVHERVHTGEKPYCCKFCGKLFAYKANLNVHEMIHTGTKPFRCRFCDKAFTIKCNMARHERVHTGEKPFSCIPCGKNFSQLSGLINHKKTHTTFHLLVCSNCQKPLHFRSHPPRVQTKVLCRKCKAASQKNSLNVVRSENCYQSSANGSDSQKEVQVLTSDTSSKCLNPNVSSNNGLYNGRAYKTIAPNGRVNYNEKPKNMRKNLKPHPQSNSKKIPKILFTCSDCNKRFIDSHSLALHNKRRHPKTLLKTK